MNVFNFLRDSIFSNFKFCSYDEKRNKKLKNIDNVEKFLPANTESSTKIESSLNKTNNIDSDEEKTREIFDEKLLKNLNLSNENQSADSVDRLVEIDLAENQEENILPEVKMLSNEDFFEQQIEKISKNFAQEWLEDIPKIVLQYLSMRNDAIKNFQNQEINLRFLANLFGCVEFKNKKFICNSKVSELEGVFSALAVFNFMKSMETFSKKLENPGWEFDQWNKIQKGYQKLYFSTLLKHLIIELKSASKEELPEEKFDKFKRFISSILKDQIVNMDKTSRVYWFSGFNEHFIPLRVKKNKKTSNYKMSLFNLGAGASNINQQVVGEKLQSEMRLGEYISSGEKIFCTPSFLEKNLDRLCDGIVDQVDGSEESWSQLINELKPKDEEGKAIVQNFPSSTPKKPQIIGNCTCVGQWALLLNECKSLKIPYLYREFKDFFFKEVLDCIQKDFGFSETSKDFRIDENKECLTHEEIYNICLRKWEARSKK